MNSSSVDWLSDGVSFKGINFCFSSITYKNINTDVISDNIAPNTHGNKYGNSV